MDRGVWWAAVHGVAKSQTRLSNFTFTFHFHALEKEMATHSIVPAWRIPRMGEPGGLPSMGSHRVGHGWSDLASAAAYTVEVFSHIAINLFKDSSNILCSPKLRHYWSLHRKIISFMLICALPNLYYISITVIKYSRITILLLTKHFNIFL